MQDMLSNDFGFAVLIIGGILGFLSVFIILLVVLFYRRAASHRTELSNLQRLQSNELLRSALNAQEEERKRIGSDIHDDLGPLLSLLKLQLSNIAKEHDATIRTEQIKESKKTIDTVIEDIRRVSADLSPSVLYELGLEEAILHMEQKLSLLTKASTDFRIDCSIEDISPTQSLAIYRILQEGLNNIIKHAHAQNITVSLYCKSDHIHIEIEDDGTGFEIDNKAKSFGLNNIQARANMFQGELSINSTINEGTKLIVKMKIDETKD